MCSSDLGWNVRMGGVSLKRSPFADRVPADCVGYADRIGQTNHYSLNSRSLLFDVLNFRGRVSEGTIDTLLDGRDYAIKCFGYAILNGLHGDAAGVANFTERWVDKEGRPVVSVSVQYHQTLKDIGFNNHGEASK